MSGKKKADSRLPAGDFQWSTGSNYGQGGYSYDTSYNEGAHPRPGGGDDFDHPQTGGFADLPDGLMDPKLGYVKNEPEVDFDEGSDLTAMIEEGYFDPTEAVDLEWLDPTQEPDLNRLPSTNFDVLTDLVKEWAANRPSRAEGNLNRIPEAKDLDVERQQVGDTAKKSPTDEIKARDQVKDAALQAMRRLSYGEDFSVVAVDTQMRLGSLAPRAIPLMERLAEDQGLLGNVFVREVAFPRLQDGQWKSELKKAKSAQYIIPIDGSVIASHDVFLGKQVVSEVPWKEAFESYAPRLASLGYTIPQAGSYRDRLQQAFLHGAPVATGVRWASDQPVHVSPSERVSLKEAKRKFKAMPKDAPVAPPKTSMEEEARRKAMIRLAHWVKEGMLDRADAVRLHASKADAHTILHTAAQLILTAKTSTYRGVGEGQLPSEAKLSRKNAWAQLRKFEAEVGQKQAEIEAAMRREMEFSLDKWQGNGELSEDQVSHLRSIDAPVKDIMRLAQTLVQGSDRRKLEDSLHRWVKAGALSDKEAKKLRAMKEPAGQVLEIAAGLIHQSGRSRPMPKAKQAATYVGDGLNQLPQESRLSRKVAWDALTKIEAAQAADRSEIDGKLEATNRKKALLRIAQWVQAGVLTQEDAQRLHASKADAAALLQTASKLILVAKKAAYQGSVFKERAVETPTVKLSAYENQLVRIAKEAGAKPRDVEKMLHWARLKMTEGAAGWELDGMLQGKFSSPLLKAASGLLEVLRNEHEGLSGFLYVDASAYASDAGTTGCDKGALYHRANALKTVLAMDRCANCALANAEGVCTKYQKMLITQPALTDTLAYQVENIKLANASDDYRTQALFAPGYQDDFGLQNDVLDNVSVNASADNTSLQDVLWGGWIID